MEISTDILNKDVVKSINRYLHELNKEYKERKIILENVE